MKAYIFHRFYGFTDVMEYGHDRNVINRSTQSEFGS